MQDAVGDQPRAEVTGNPLGAAWGDPAIVLRCGVPVTGPTSAPCLEAGGLDWTFTETEDDTTCGRICYQTRKINVSQVFAGQKVVRVPGRGGNSVTRAA